MFKEPVKNRRHLARLLHFQIFLERKKLQGGEQKLACKERPEVAFYPEGGDAEKDKGQPDKEACHAVEKGLVFPRPCRMLARVEFIYRKGHMNPRICR